MCLGLIVRVCIYLTLSFYQDEREEALDELKAIEAKYNELKVSPESYHTSSKVIIISVTALIDQEEMGQYADNDPAAFEATS